MTVYRIICSFAARGPRHSPLIFDGPHVGDGPTTNPVTLNETDSQFPDCNEKDEGIPARHERRAGMEVLPHAEQQVEGLGTLRHRPQQSQTLVAAADRATHNSSPETSLAGDGLCLGFGRS